MCCDRLRIAGRECSVRRECGSNSGGYSERVYNASS